MSVPLTATLPVGDTAFARDLHARHASRTLRTLLTLERGGLTPAIQQGLVSLQARLGAAFREARAATLELVGHPTLSTLVACAERAETPSARSQHVEALVPAAAFQLALAGLAGETPLLWARHVPSVASAPHDVVLELAGHTRLAAFLRDALLLWTPSGERRVELGDVAALRTLSTPDAHGRAAFAEIAPGTVLAEHDNNPLSMHELHPDKSGNAVDLGGRPRDEWLAAMRAALELVATGVPLVREEMTVMLRQAVPVGYSDDKHLSASYFEAIGTIYLTLHPNPMTMAEAIVHEFQHNKLNALLHFDPVLHNGFTSLHKSPVRPDLRPLMGVLLAVHAFVPVAEMYVGLRRAGAPLARSDDFARRFRAIVAKNEEGLVTLRASAEPSEAGRALLAELERWHAGHVAAEL